MRRIGQGRGMGRWWNMMIEVDRVGTGKCGRVGTRAHAVIHSIRIDPTAWAQVPTLPRCFELQTIQVGVHAVHLQQFGMAAFLDDAAMVEHDDAIGMFDGRQAMRDD